MLQIFYSNKLANCGRVAGRANGSSNFLHSGQSEIQWWKCISSRPAAGTALSHQHAQMKIKASCYTFLLCVCVCGFVGLCVSGVRRGSRWCAQLGRNLPITCSNSRPAAIISLLFKQCVIYSLHAPSVRILLLIYPGLAPTPYSPATPKMRFST